MRKLLIVVGLSVSAVGCGSSSDAPANLAAACEAFSSAVCNRFFNCDATAAAATYGTVAACITDISNSNNCSTVSCIAPKTYNSTNAQTCINDLTGQACADNENGVIPPNCTLNSVCT